MCYLFLKILEVIWTGTIAFLLKEVQPGSSSSSLVQFSAHGDCLLLRFTDFILEESPAFLDPYVLQ